MKNSYLLFTTLLFAIISLLPINFIKSPGQEFSPYYFVFGLIIFLFGLVVVLSSEWRITQLDKGLLVVMFGFALSVFNSIDLMRTVLYLMSYFLRGVLVAFIGIRVLRPKTVVYNMTVIVGLVALVGLVEFFTGWNPLFRILPEMGKFFRESYRVGIAGTIGHSLPLAVFLTLFLPLAGHFFREKPNIFNFFLLVLIVGAIIFSFSRSCLITGSLAVILYFSAGFNWRQILRALLLILVVIGTAFIFVLKFPGIHQSKEEILSRFHPASFYRELFYYHRAASYGTVKNILKKYPWTGVGLGNYPLVHEKYRVPGTTLDLKTPDNMYLRLLSETGIIGTAIFIVFLFYWLKKFWNWRQNLLVRALFCGLLSFTINMIIGDFFHWYQLQFAFWFLLGVAARLSSAEMPVND